MALKLRPIAVAEKVWVRPTDQRRHLIACCDCGLSHFFEFRVVDGQVEFRARRAPRYTAQQRRRRLQK